MAKYKSTNPTANKKLSALEKELLGHAKKGQPVLLYGKSTNSERINLIKKIHEWNGGIDANWEYIGEETDINRPEYLSNAMLKTLEEYDKLQAQGTMMDIDDYRKLKLLQLEALEDYGMVLAVQQVEDEYKMSVIHGDWMNNYDSVKAERLLYYIRTTSKTWRRIDCNFNSGKDVFDILHNKFELFDDIFDARFANGIDFCPKEKWEMVARVENTFSFYKKQVSNLSFLNCKGLLFVDNLKCTLSDPKDEEWYSRLGDSIHSHRARDCDSGNWLVVYTRDPDPFPDIFKDQFEPISLDSKDYEADKQKKKRKSRISDKEFKQLCEEVEKGCKKTLAGETVFFREVSKLSKARKYDPTGHGYTPCTSKKRYYEVYPPK